MTDLINIVEKVLIDEATSQEGVEKTKEWLEKQREARMISKGACSYRLCRSLTDLELGNGSWKDFASHLRQFILNFKRSVYVNSQIKDNLNRFAVEFGITINGNEVNVSKEFGEYFPKWIEDPGQLLALNDLPQRRTVNSVIGDGILYKMTNHTHYASKHQKQIIRASLNLSPGSTLLACMPTGGGKSLVGQMPAFFETEGGTLSGAIEGVGCTIVVVPTVALAIDQEASSRQYFSHVTSEEHLPTAYYGGMSEEKRKTVYSGIRNGTMPILYTSPEAILNSILYHILLDAAKEGKINRLVIDEAHIVIDWGTSFRTEFQLLAILRTKLLEASNGRLRTLLLSATLTTKTTDILRELFSEGDNFIEFRSDSLRPELMFWLNKVKSEGQRRERILELLPLLPRPLILYVNSPNQAEDWRQIIEDRGFSSVTTFTGKTTSSQREGILQKWNDNKIDIIVATSAFGMGVDKSDVRVVMHGCMPESINRFYQEVGRGGRDGFPSLSITCVVPTFDYDKTFKLINSSVLTVENMTSRWTSLRNHPFETLGGDVFWVDTDRKPAHLKEQHTGQQNAEFNEVTLLFLFRKGFIDILDIRQGNSENRRHILVKMKNVDLLADSDLLQEELKPIRTKEWKDVHNAYLNMKELIQDYQLNCWSEYFNETYPYTLDDCGGCPKCREEGYYPIQVEKNIEIIGQGNWFTKHSLVKGKINKYLGLNSELLLTVENKESLASDLQGILVELIKSGINDIVVPKFDQETWAELVKELPYENCDAYTLYEIDEVLEGDERPISSPLAVVYPDNEELSDRIYNWTQSFVQAEDYQVIHVARDFYVPSQRKNLGELVDGLQVHAKNFVMEDSQDIVDWL